MCRSSEGLDTEKGDIPLGLGFYYISIERSITQKEKCLFLSEVVLSNDVVLYGVEYERLFFERLFFN